MRWFVEITRVGKSEVLEKLCLEAAHWQPALKDARRLRGEGETLEGMSVEFLDDGCSAIHPGQRLRYVVTRAPDDAPIVQPGPSGEPGPTDDKVPPAKSSQPGLGPTTARPGALAPGKRGTGLESTAAESPQGKRRDELPSSNKDAPKSRGRTMGYETTAEVRDAVVKALANQNAAREATAPVAQVRAKKEKTAEQAPLLEDVEPDPAKPGRVAPPDPDVPPISPRMRPAGKTVVGIGSDEHTPPAGTPLSQPPPSRSSLAGDGGPRGARPSTHPGGAQAPKSYTVMSSRNVGPSAAMPLSHHERAFALNVPIPMDRLESFARDRLADVRAELADVPPGRVVDLAIFETPFSGTPSKPPVLTLRWCDWLGEPEVAMMPYGDGVAKADAIAAPIVATADSSEAAPALEAAPPPSSANASREKLLPKPPSFKTVASAVDPATPVPTKGVVVETAKAETPHPPTSRRALGSRRPLASAQAAKADEQSNKPAAKDPAPKKPGKTVVEGTASAGPTSRRNIVTRGVGSGTLASKQPTEESGKQQLPAKSDGGRPTAKKTLIAGGEDFDSRSTTKRDDFDSRATVKKDTPAAKPAAAAKDAPPSKPAAAKDAPPSKPAAAKNAAPATPAIAATPKPDSTAPKDTPSGRGVPRPAARGAEPTSGRAPTSSGAPSSRAPAPSSRAPAPIRELSREEKEAKLQSARVRASSFPPPPSRAGKRVDGDELLSDMFESISELHFMNDALDGAGFVLALALEKLPSEVGMVSLFDLDRREFVVVRQEGGAKSALLLRIPESTAIAKAAMKNKHAVVVSSAADLAAMVDLRWKEIGTTPRSLICAPVEIAGRYLGLIELANPQDGRGFKEGDGHALSYIGKQFAEFLDAKGVLLDPDAVLAAAEADSL